MASIELLATTVALMVFGGSGAVATGLAGRVSIAGCTDNMSASYVVDRYMSTAFPLSVVLMELACQLDALHLDLELRWIPRMQNEAADDLSKEQFGRFSLENRIDVELESLPFIATYDGGGSEFGCGDPVDASIQVGIAQ